MTFEEEMMIRKEHSIGWPLQEAMNRRELFISKIVAYTCVWLAMIQIVGLLIAFIAFLIDTL